MFIPQRLLRMIESIVIIVVSEEKTYEIFIHSEIYLWLIGKVIKQYETYSIKLKQSTFSLVSIESKNMFGLFLNTEEISDRHKNQYKWIYIIKGFHLINFQMKILGNIVKSKSDKRSYKAIQLANRIKCLLISDEQAEKSAAALSVGVGSLRDPKQAQGLVHYLEHMLFMGTQKYPSENQYSAFITKNAGSSNAYTDQAETNYHFEVSSAAFNETLDRFAQFFIAPIMDDSSSQRQLLAVHSQHSKNLQSDVWRKFQLTKHLAKQNHPFNKFSTGDKNSLNNKNLRQMLLKFYKENYSSNIMNLVLYDRQSVDDLSNLAQKMFSDVKDLSYQKTIMDQMPYDQKTFNKIIKLVPIKDRKFLQLNWILKDKAPFYKSDPGNYVSFLIGHEGTGSLLADLIAEGLATELSSSHSNYYDCFTKFSVKVGLTEKGLANYHSIIERTFGYIQMLKKQGPQQWVFKEIQNINRMKFDFLDKRKGMGFVSSIARVMLQKPIEQVFVYPYLLQEWKPEQIQQYLNELKTQNLMTIIQAKQFQTECTETQPIYGTKYTLQERKPIKVISGNVHLPKPNVFIPSNLQILKMGTQSIPQLIKDTERIQAYYKLDHRFGLPKMNVYLRLYYGGQNTPYEEVIRTLFKNLFEQKARDLIYMGEMANISSSVSFSTYHVDLHFSGFRDAINKYVEPYLKELIQFVPTDETLFQNLKEKLIRSYNNYFLNNPYQLAYELQIQALRAGNDVLPFQRLKVAQKISLEDIILYSKKWKNKLYMQSLISGNVQVGQATVLIQRIQNLVQETEKLEKARIGDIRAVFLPNNKVYGIENRLMNPNQENSSVIVHFQYEQFKIRTKLLQDICLLFMKEPAFDYLRTKQQLGYIVMCLPDDHRGVLGMSILLQSSIKTSYEMIQYVDKFINEILKQKLEQLNQTTFEQFKKSLLQSKTQKDKDLANQALRFWSEITKHAYKFGRKEQQIETLPTITLQEFKQFAKWIFYENFRRLEIHMMAQKETQRNKLALQRKLKNDSQYKVFTDANSFKKRMNLYPDYYSHL